MGQPCSVSDGSSGGVFDKCDRVAARRAHGVVGGSLSRRSKLGCARRLPRRLRRVGSRGVRGFAYAVPGAVPSRGAGQRNRNPH